jgi:ATP-binding cassette, subfamily B, bacterial
VSLAPSDRLVLRAALRPRGWVIVLVVAAIARIAATLAFPALLARAVQAAGTGLPSPAVLGMLAGTVGTIVVAGAMAQLANVHCVTISTAWLRRIAVRHALDADTAGSVRLGAGDIVGRVTGATTQASGLVSIVVESAAGVLVSIGAMMALGVIGWPLLVVVLAGAPAQVLLTRPVVRRNAASIGEYLRAGGDVSARLLDAVSGLRSIHATGTADEETQRVLAPLPRMRTAGLEFWQVLGRGNAIGPTIGQLTVVGVLAVGGYGLSIGRISAGGLLAAASYAALAAGAFNQTAVLTALTRARAAGGRIAGLAGSSRRPRAETVALPPGAGRLELRAVTVHDDTGTARLTGVDLIVPSGGRIAVVGRSGAGKSLLAAVVAGLRAPDEGQVLLDGIDLTAIDADRVRATVACAFDRPALIGDTVADAIGYGWAATRSDVVSAARTAQVHHVILRLPHGYDTPLDEVALSGGEAQRVGLARALVRRSRLLVLDDATASLDDLTDLRISTALDAELPGQTRLIVTRRPGTAAAADLTVWLDGGRIRAVDRHESLLGEPEYRALFVEGR